MRVAHKVKLCEAHRTHKLDLLLRRADPDARQLVIKLLVLGMRLLDAFGAEDMVLDCGWKITEFEYILNYMKGCGVHEPTSVHVNLVHQDFAWTIMWCIGKS